MRKLWARVAYGRHTNKAQDLEESSVDPATMGGDPAPGYQWNVEKRNGYLYVQLQMWNGKRWVNYQTEGLSQSKDFSVGVPIAKRNLWQREQHRVKNERYLASIKP